MTERKRLRVEWRRNDDARWDLRSVDHHSHASLAVLGNGAVDPHRIGRADGDAEDVAIIGFARVDIPIRLAGLVEGA